MNKKDQFQFLKKLNILKSFLISDNIEIQKLLDVFEDLFNNKETTVIEIKKRIEKGDNLEAINLLNATVNSIREMLFQNPCSKDWWNLIDTNKIDVKYCTDCNKNVYKVYNEADFKKRKNLAQCVAVNPLEFNVPSDLHKNYKSCFVKDNTELGFPM